MAYLQFEAMGIEALATDLSVSYIDHNTLQMGFENADDHRYLMGIARKYGIYLSRAGNGICHQVHLERFGKPGRHSARLGQPYAYRRRPRHGGDRRRAASTWPSRWAARPSSCPAPRWSACSQGRLGPWVSAKDLVLKMLEIFGTKGNVGRIFEYAGPGLGSPPVPERATVANMGAECGVTTSIFPSDEATRRLPALPGPRGRLASVLSAPIPTPSTRRRSR
jgi:aconitate hydratase